MQILHINNNMFYLYKITNIINNRVYIGVHKTDNVDDGYMGSGKLIKLAIQKHGLENFKKEILEVHNNEKDAYLAESKVVTENFILKENAYNLRPGGRGGWKHLSAEKRHRESRLAALKIHNRPIEEKLETFKKISESLIGKKYNKGTLTPVEETSRKRKEQMVGKKLHPLTRKWVSREVYDEYIKNCTKISKSK